MSIYVHINCDLHNSIFYVFICISFLTFKCSISTTTEKNLKNKKNGQK